MRLFILRRFFHHQRLAAAILTQTKLVTSPCMTTWGRLTGLSTNPLYAGDPAINLLTRLKFSINNKQVEVRLCGIREDRTNSSRCVTFNYWLVTTVFFINNKSHPPCKDAKFEIATLNCISKYICVVRTTSIFLQFYVKYINFNHHDHLIFVRRSIYVLLQFDVQISLRRETVISLRAKFHKDGY